jgi:spore coat protein U-like protein
MRLLCLAATAMGVAMAAQGALAATQSVGVSVSANVSSVCAISAGSVTFSQVALTGTTDTSAIVSTTCTNGAVYSVGLDNGLNNLAGQRRLVSGVNSLNYDLFKDPGHLNRWGNTAGVDTAAGVGTGLSQDLTIWGEVAGGQTLTSDNGTAFADTVQVTITY